jgi:hypothetical protein
MGNVAIRRQQKPMAEVDFAPILRSRRIVIVYAGCYAGDVKTCVALSYDNVHHFWTIRGKVALECNSLFSKG